MSEIISSEELRKAIDGGVERIVLPANANLLLDDASLSGEQIERLEVAARECGRLVHRR